MAGMPPVESESPPVESESPPVESDSPPVESDSPPVESDSPPVESDGLSESSTPPVEPVPLAFIYTCKHFICRSFRRADGNPLAASDITHPDDPDLLSEPIDLSVSPEVSPEVCFASSLCNQCKKSRIQSFRYVKKCYEERPDLAIWHQTTLRRMRDNDLAMDVSLMAKVFGTEKSVWDEQERIGRLMIAPDPPPVGKEVDDRKDDNQAPPENKTAVLSHTQAPPATDKRAGNENANDTASLAPPAKKRRPSPTPVQNDLEQS
ncbi:hypothetical protein MMC07_008547 [Pseudocyphellaria aurata]|nr:hypothetical protein [Pseudocyphellaria aurata]